MLVDIHSHAWSYPEHFSDDFRNQAMRARAGVEVDLTVRYDEYRQSAEEADVSVVFGGKARLSGLWVDDQYVADYVAQDPKRLRGFLSVDPTQSGWQQEMLAGHQELGLRGIKLLPMYAGFRPMMSGSIRCGNMRPNTTYRSCSIPARPLSPSTARMHTPQAY